MLLSHARLLALFAVLCALATACDDAGDEPATDTISSDTASDVDVLDTSEPDTSAPDTGDALDTAEPGDVPGDTAQDTSGDDVPPGDVGDADAPDSVTPERFTESEPNDGATLDEIDVVPPGALVQVDGALGTPGDQDVFAFDTTPGAVYRVTLEGAPGSLIEPNLTVLDDGRGGDAAGADYVRIVESGAGEAVELVFVAMGEPGYLFAVRDARNVAGTGDVGGENFEYFLNISVVDATTFVRGPLPLGSSASDALAHPGDLALYAFEGSEGSNLVVDLSASGDMDARLYVFAQATGDWIARNDDRAAGDPDPLIDAPLTASGAMWLIVENIAPGATGLGYTLSAQ